MSFLKNLAAPYIKAAELAKARQHTLAKMVSETDKK